MSLTTNPNDPCLKEGQKEIGQNECYLVLTEFERSQGFVRPYRDSYVHVGKKIERDEEGRLFGRLFKMDEPEYPSNEYYTKEKGYGGFISYPEGHHSIGRYIMNEEVEAIVARKRYFGGCGVRTKMGQAISETYARNPEFYGCTFCIGCNKHLPVEHFVWDGTEETVGS